MVRRTPHTQAPITSIEYLLSLRRFVLSTGVERIMEATEARRSTVYTWISRESPAIPSGEHRRKLDELMQLSKAPTG